MATDLRLIACDSINDVKDLLRRSEALYVGVGGDVRVRTRAGTDVTFFNVPAGSILPIEFIRVWNTGTTASQMVGLI